MTPEEYADTVQVDIDAIVAVGDIRTQIDAIALLFPNIYGAYIGLDSRSHMISYYVFETALSGVGYIPTGTDVSKLFVQDTTQIQYSMLPIINYVRAFYTLSAYATVNNPSHIQLNLGTYNQYIGTYYTLQSFLQSFDNHYVVPLVPLYQFVTSTADLQTNMADIMTQLYTPLDPEPNITTFVNNLTVDFSATLPYKIGIAEQNVLVLARVETLIQRNNDKVFIP